MSRSTSDGLARITIASPRRRLDVAVPEHVVVAELMPALLNGSGEDLADNGQQHGGWVLRRSTGVPIDSGRSLSAQQVLDGEVLHLVARQDDWPEMDYDDVVDAIATSARRSSRSWTGAATRRAGLAIAGAIAALILLSAVVSGPPWRLPAVVCVSAAVVLLIAAGALARVLSDPGGAAVVAVAGMPLALAGGTLMLLDDRPVGGLRPAHLLLGGAALLLYCFLAYSGVGHETHWFVAGITAALLLIIGAALDQIWQIGSTYAAAVVLTTAVVLTPVFPVLAMRLGKLPVPALPTSTEDLLADPPSPPLPRVHATVRRSDELLTGMLTGAAIGIVVSSAVLILARNGSAVVLVALACGASLLRGRLFPAVRHRVPLMVGGCIGFALIAAAWTLQGGSARLLIGTGALLLLALACLALGRYFSQRRPSPYLGRIADIMDVLLVVAIVPVMCLVVGLFGYLRGLYG